MKTVATFSNYAEAGFVQNMLRDEGIESFMPDAGAVPVGVYEIPIQVADADWERARQIVDQFKSEPRQPAQTTQHPASGFPFLGIMGFVAILWAMGTAVWVFLADDSATSLLKRAGLAIATGALSIIGGLSVGFFVALVCLIARPVFRKIKAE